MKSKFFFLGAASLLLASCSSELDMPVNQVLGEGKTPLMISVAEQPFTKATGQKTGTSLSSGSELGVFVTAEDGSSYDGNSYNNIKFTSTGTGVQQSWAHDPSTPVMLSDTKAKVYAYYPRQASGVSLSSITISNDGNDWMYTPTAASNVSMLSPTASLSMEHAMSIIRVKVVAGANNSSETINQLTVDGTGWATSATLNLKNGTIGSYVGEGTQLVANNLGTLSTTGVTHDFWAVSNLTASVITFKVMVGENVFKVNTPAAVTLERGRVYTYVLNVENLNGASLASVSTKDWISEDVVNFDTNVMTFADFMHEKFQGITTDGVYAVKSDGTPVAYAKASDASYSAVAFVIKGKAYQVAKVDATGYNGSSDVYWQKTGYSDISGLTNYTTADGTNDSGYLTVTSGTLLSKDPSTWGDGALGDFNGQANTATILAAQNNGADVNTIGKAVMDFRSGSNNEGKEDWFAPSCGELAYMFLMKTELNTLLGKVSGSQLTSSDHNYWSSSEYGSYAAWRVYFSNGYVSNSVGSNKGMQCRLRLVRAI